MSVAFSDVSYVWPDGTALFTDLSFTLGVGRTGLVAPNGAGKTTLLNLIAGRCRPSAGAVVVDGTVGYLPQHLPFVADATVAEVLGIAPVLAALDALAAGDASEQVFTAIGEHWDIEERSLATLDRLGLGQVGLRRALGSLSGGEVVTLGLAAQLMQRPDVLLLDEPTNNLDVDARRRLYDALDDYPGCLLVVSHDRTLLDRMDRIAELHRGELLVYGGNYQAYCEQVEAAQRAAHSEVRSAEQQLRLEKRQRQQARERAARRSGTAHRTAKDAGLPKIVLGAMKRRAQESAGRSDGVHAARLAAARSRLERAEEAIRDDDTMVLDLPGTAVPAGRMVFSGCGLTVATVLRGIDLSIRGPERIALTGANGVGKSTLLRILSGELTPDAGSVERADGRIAYLSQRLDLLDPDRTVAQSLAAFAPTLSVTRRRHLLAQFLFSADRIHLPVRALSGGERLRATLACVLYAEPAPQLLLLDEPTNNLDLVSVAQLEAALRAYRGAFLVVSHDDRFLDAIGVHRRLRLADGALVPG
ncbi:ABC-F family ATP-binding cassette domain-containing protein [Mycolicibacterium thermoresistibile]